MKNPNFVLSVDTRLLINALRSIEAGETATYAALSEAVGKPITGGSPALQSALRHMFSNDRIVFANVRGSGYQRLVDTDIVKASGRDTDMIRRRARRAAKRLGSVANYEGLPKDMQVEHNTRLSVLAAISEATRGKTVARIRDQVQARGGELPLAATLEAFKE